MARALEELIKKYFGPIINAETYEDIRLFLRKQDPDEVEQFLRFFGWKHYEDRRVVVEQELAKLRAAPKSLSDAIEGTPTFWGVGINLKKLWQLVSQRLGGRGA